MRNDICKLITRITTGSEVEEIENEVWCDKKSCVRSEYYTAYAVGLKPRFVLKVDTSDFESCAITVDGVTEYPTRVNYQGQILEILRDYADEKKPDETELTIG